MTDWLALVDAQSLVLLGSIFVILALAAWLGRFVSLCRLPHDPQQDEGLKIVLGATLSLFGLLMGFLLSFAISGYNARISAEENEAIAFANAFQRITLLPSSALQDQAHEKLQQYLRARIAFYEAKGEVQRAELRMQAIHTQAKMWNFVSDIAKNAPNPLSMSLVEACNQLYITQQKTMAGWRQQIPLAAWLVLVVFALCSNFLIGYNIRGQRKTLALVVPFVTALALFMIAEIDVPGKGVIHVTPDNLYALRWTLGIQ